MLQSDWVQRWTHLIREGSTVLDIACGPGRHLNWFASKGHHVTGIDRDVSAAKAAGIPATLVEADVEATPWPLQTSKGIQQFDVVVVTNYLWRPLLPTVLQSVAPGGFLIYETFAVGNEQFGRPSRPDFLLQPGELLSVCSAFHTIAYENGVCANPMRCVQRLVAQRPAEPRSTSTSQLGHML